MAIKNLAKAEALIRDLKDKLAKRSQNSAAGRVNSVREARDTQGYPFLVLSRDANEAAGQPVILIRIKQIDAVSKDIFGNDLNAYAPHICELAYELDGTEAEPSRLDIIMSMYELAALGIRIQVKQVADATAVTATSVDAAAVAEDIDLLYWPTKGS
jgi:hypothetical protein